MLAQQMGLAWHDFRRTHLAVWRSYVDGLLKSQKDAMLRLAWQVQYTLIAAGADADAVPPEKLLAPAKKRKRRVMSDEEKFE